MSRPRPQERAPERGTIDVRSDAAADRSLVARAHGTPLTRGAIADLALIEVPVLSRALAEALAARDIKAATALALAIAAAGGTLEPAMLARLLADADPGEIVPALLRACGGSTADKLERMREAIESGQLSHDREAVVAFVASRMLGDPPWPSPWPGLLRTLARQRLGDEAGVLLGRVIEASGDAHLRAVGEEWVRLAEHADADEIASPWVRGWEEPILAILPETEPPRVVAGYTVRKAPDRPGRNDPCHCGSGKKYKKCHAPSDDAADRSREAPPVDLAKLTPIDIGGMRVQEVLALPFEKLQRPALVTAIEQLNAYHRWQDAERALDELAQRGPGQDVDELRGMLIDEALRMRAFDVADRQLAKLGDREGYEARARASLACARPSAQTLAVLDEQASKGLRGDHMAARQVAYALLDHAPALGIFVARGALDPAHVDASDGLLEEIEYARDRLELSPDDPFGPLFDAWVEEREIENAEAERTAAEIGRLRGELEAARRELDARRAETVALERELRDARERLQKQAHRENAAAGPADEVLAAHRAAEERAQRLARKVEELKALLAEGNAERASLRERVAELEAARREAMGPREPDVADLPAPSDEDEGSAAPGEETIPVRIPVFVRTAAEAIRTMPAKVQRAAVAVAGRLGAGERAAWREVKRMQGMEGIWTARVGIHHRLIFRVTDDELVVMDVVTREALLTSLERYR